MGRKGSYADKPVKGPGRKAKKQGAPVLKSEFKGKFYIWFIIFVCSWVLWKQKKLKA